MRVPPKIDPNDLIDPDPGWPGPDTFDRWGRPISRRNYWRLTVGGFFFSAALLIFFGFQLRSDPSGSGQFSGYLILGGLTCAAGGIATILWLKKGRESRRWG